MRVLLPAPFSPMSAWTSPRRTVKSTPCKALTPGKFFARPRISRSVPAANSIVRWVGTRSTASPITFDKMGRDGTRPYHPSLRRSFHLRSLILPFGQFGRGLRLFEHTLLNRRALGQRLFRQDGFHCVKKLRADKRIALDGAIEFAGGHGFKCAADTVNGDNEDVFAWLYT